MDVVYDPTCLEHYGVGHDKGGHSGRYPWGSGAKKKYIKKVQKKLNRKPTVNSHVTAEIQKLPGTDLLANTPEISSAYSKMRNACNEYSKFIEEVDTTMHKDTAWLNNKVDELRSKGVADEMSEIYVYFDSDPGSTIFEEYLKEHPTIFATENKKWEAQEAAEHEYAQEIAKQFQDLPMSKITFSDGDVYFRGLPDIQYALTRTLDERYKTDKKNLDKNLDDKDKKGGKA